MSKTNNQVGGNHYDMPIQPRVFIRLNNILFDEGNIIKYICRYNKKNGLEDLQKVLQYCDFIEESGEFGDSQCNMSSLEFSFKNNLSYEQSIIVFMVSDAISLTTKERLGEIRNYTNKLIKKYK